MKIKLQLNKKALQVFFLQNVEKIVFGFVALGFIYLVYSALTHVDRYDKTPEQLKQAAQSGRAKIDETKDPPEKVANVVDYVAEAKRSRTRIEEKPYSCPAFWDQPLFPKPSLREVPPLLCVDKLQGQAEVGSFTVTAMPVTPLAAPPAERTRRTENQPTPPPAGGVENRGEHWIVITGLIPMEKQTDAYNTTFRGPFHLATDIPDYRGYYVERLEVTSPGEADDPDWTKAERISSVKAIADLEKKLGLLNNPDTIPLKYIDPRKRMVFPLPTLANRPWGESIAHLPEIPLQELGMYGDPTPGRDGRGGPRAAEGQVTPPGEPGPDGTPAPRSEDSGFGTNENPTPGPGHYPQAPYGQNPQDLKAPSYLLFRYLDFNVGPGKNYIYRVQLVLGNPNSSQINGLKLSWLKDPNQAKSDVLKTEWSKPSPVISVPQDTRLLLVSAKKDYQILAIKWVKRKGIEAFDKFSIDRGQIANYPDKTFTPTSGANRVYGGAMMPHQPGPLPYGPPMGPGYPRPPQQLPQPGFAAGQTGAFKVHYFSGMTAIDFRGGERPKGSKLASVGEVLLMEPDGALIVRNELDDKPTYDKLTAKEPTPGAAVGPIGPPTHPGNPARKGLGDMEPDGTKKKVSKKTANPKPMK